MGKGRLEAFSDGVLAIIITIMVLELHVPHEATLEALSEVAPKFFSYGLSYVFVGIYWNNHHHLWQAVKSVNGSILWANLHLLFWLSLIPFTAAWMGETNFAMWPVILYGVVLLGAALAYYVLARALVAHHGADSAIGLALGKDTKGLVSLGLYVLAIVLGFLNPWLGFGVYVVVAVMWLIPDRRIENTLKDSQKLE